MPDVIEQSLSQTRQAYAKFYIPKIELGASYFKAKAEGLLHHIDPGKTWAKKILPELMRVEGHNAHFRGQPDNLVDAIVFPELSIPQEVLGDLAAWSKANNV